MTRPIYPLPPMRNLRRDGGKRLRCFFGIHAWYYGAASRLRDYVSRRRCSCCGVEQDYDVDLGAWIGTPNERSPASPDVPLVAPE